MRKKKELDWERIDPLLGVMPDAQIAAMYKVGDNYWAAQAYVRHTRFLPWEKGTIDRETLMSAKDQQKSPSISSGSHSLRVQPQPRKTRVTSLPSFTANGGSWGQVIANGFPLTIRI